jgi:hypothetical protein
LGPTRLLRNIHAAGFFPLALSGGPEGRVIVENQQQPAPRRPLHSQSPSRSSTNLSRFTQSM